MLRLSDRLTHRFVAKPIGRLGGPGLIPVAFVQIRDPVTGQPLAEFPANIPQVEEWKKATAEYKAAAIPLGRLDLAPDQRVANSPYEAAAQAAQQAQGGGMVQVDHRNSYNSAGAQSAGQGHQRQASNAESQASARSARSGYKPEQDALLPLGELIQLGVPSFHNESGNYWFRLHAAFVPDETSEPAYTLILYRTYEDFYDFQITLLDTFPTEAGRPRPGEEDRSPPPRILPYMPGPVDEAIDDELTEYRRDELDAYVHALLDLRAQGAGYILRHELIRAFFAAKYGDYCEEMPRSEAIGQLEASLQGMSLNGSKTPDYSTQPFSSSRPEPQPQPSPTPQSNWANQPSQAQAQQLHSQPQSYSHSQPQPTSHSHSQPQPHSQPPLQPHSQPQPTHTLQPNAPTRPPRAAAFVKIKIYDRQTDDLIALRVHPAVTYAELLDKVRARLGPDVNTLLYRVGGGPVAEGPNRAIRDDRELADWIGVEDQRLVLYAEQ